MDSEIEVSEQCTGQRSKANANSCSNKHRHCTWIEGRRPALKTQPRPVTSSHPRDCVSPCARTRFVPRSMNRMATVPRGSGMEAITEKRKGASCGSLDVSVYEIAFFKLSTIRRPVMYKGREWRVEGRETQDGQTKWYDEKIQC